MKNLISIVAVLLMTGGCTSTPIVKDVFYNKDGKLMMNKCQLSQPLFSIQISDCNVELVGGGR